MICAAIEKLPSGATIIATTDNDPDGRILVEEIADIVKVTSSDQDLKCPKLFNENYISHPTRVIGVAVLIQLTVNHHFLVNYMKYSGMKIFACRNSYTASTCRVVCCDKILKSTSLWRIGTSLRMATAAIRQSTSLRTVYPPWRQVR